MSSWLDEIILDRPEYVKQPEAILTDLLWRSSGSSLSSGNNSALSNLRSLKLGGQSLERIVFQSRMGRPVPLETYKRAEEAQQASLFLNTTGENPFKPILRSLAAPRARGSKSGACVPVDPSLVLLQTLHGLANKKAPPNMANVVDSAAWHGGAQGKGYAGYAFLAPFAHMGQDPRGLTGLLSSTCPYLADAAWQSYKDACDSPTITSWPQTPFPVASMPVPQPSPSPLSFHETPFKWFWKYWSRLCDNQTGWFNMLPARRWTDWSLCLLRTGLALGYLWESQLLIRIEAAAREHSSGPRGTEWMNLSDFLSGSYTVARLEDPALPASHRNCIEALRRILLDGHAAREVLRNSITNQNLQTVTSGSADLLSAIDTWLNSEGQPGSGQPHMVERYGYESLPKNTYEFVRYSLLQRPSDDDTWDQADFYYLSRTDKSRKNFWFEPGPEWLVVVVSLCAGKPRGTCTLRELQVDLRLLGLHVERPILVKMLESYGLSTDSPDADDALIIHSGF